MCLSGMVPPLPPVGTPHLPLCWRLLGITLTPIDTLWCVAGCGEGIYNACIRAKVRGLDRDGMCGYQAGK